MPVSIERGVRYAGLRRQDLQARYWNHMNIRALGEPLGRAEPDANPRKASRTINHNNAADILQDATPRNMLT